MPLVDILHLRRNLFQLFLRIIDQRSELGALLTGHHVLEQDVYLFPHRAGCIVHDVQECLILPMQVGHEMLGSLGKVQDRL